MGLVGWIALGLLVCGFCLTVIGWRGRQVGEGPHCSKCGFDLAGTIAAHGSVCPECGRVFRGSGAFVPSEGRFERRLVPLWAGVVMLVMLSPMVVLVITPSGTALDRSMPMPVLRAQARWGSAETRRGAIEELIRRLHAGELDAARVDAIVADALTVQANPGATWTGEWGEFIEDVHAKKMLSKADAQRFAEQAVAPMALNVYTPHLSGQSVFPRLEDNGRFHGWGARMGEGSTEDTDLRIGVEVIALSLDGVEIPVPTVGYPYSPGNMLDPSRIGEEGEPFYPGMYAVYSGGIGPMGVANSSGPWTVLPRVFASPGRHQLSVTVRFGPQLGSHWAFGSFERTYELEFPVVETAAEWVKVADRRSDPDFDTGLEVTRVGPIWPPEVREPMRINIEFESAISFRLHAVAGQVQLRDSTGRIYESMSSPRSSDIALRREGPRSLAGYADLYLTQEVWEQVLANRPIDVIITPDHRLLAPLLHGSWDQSSDWTHLAVRGTERIEAGSPSWWGDELVFEDVPVDEKSKND